MGIVNLSPDSFSGDGCLTIEEALARAHSLANDGADLVYTFDAQAEDTGIAELLGRLSEQGVEFKDLKTDQSSLEDIFVSLVRAPQ